MKLGIMQPYIFPYIGYFQLVNSVDRFVVYDDVAFIKQGWINRNNILLGGERHTFTVPLKNASSYTLIRETEINQQLYKGWLAKFYKTIAQAYTKAPHYDTVEMLLRSVLDVSHNTISTLATSSIVTTSEYLGIKTEIIPTATGYENNNLTAQDRVIDICKKEQADIYVNPAGGRELYSKDDFARSGLALNFIKPGNIVYPQFNHSFVPMLSIIDVLMFNAPGQINSFLKEYTLE